MASPLLQLRGISKSFSGIKVLDNIDLDIYPGEVHALLGENGAGKSTLIKIISGVYQRDCGTITFKQKPVEFTNTRQALDAGISVIHQELSLIQDLSVAENIFLGREPIKSRVFIDKEKMVSETIAIARSLGIDLKPWAMVRDLNVAEQQMVEIAKAVSCNASLVIMDEPTSSLSDRETETLFKIIKRLKKDNVAVIYISHRLKELEELADRLTILRDGKLVKTMVGEEMKKYNWVSLMVGREIKDFSRKAQKPGEVILQVKDFTDPPKYWDINFELRQGEILGIAGLVGAGRTEVLQGIFGVKKPKHGSLYLNGQKVLFNSPAEAISNGIGFVPEDRRLQGVILAQSVKDNISLPSLYDKSNYGFINFLWENQVSEDYIKKMRIRTPSAKTIVKNLSGGNQQKVALARWLAAHAKILFLDEPTRGIDVNAKAEIYNLMNSFTSEGGSIIMVSSELPEILSMSDRIVVMHEGRVAGILDRHEASEEKIMELACGKIAG
ncbi:sugar ABC transporter ATP-binding protein [Neomoorella thermoacetica]|uniref:Monosaccharide ABC transporter ATP-binding protein, CUT2 family n=1 Tax=Moorella thermoacetica (strain ATCC 39073 / JCM 9320) TaxID=264732 RepID=Q2RKU6_MOOTA|nr:sugar ABC transporter ATP-binding protein [Moorella thermoacetica]AKX96011.1 ribose import ATP-binding protein RbsA [Moorella thermoacetica]TYL08279.1 Ribose import ATP-binding protein RbsA [Moorella thermoacetica]TYL08589.1 Ribose import ATP-binding protein RbsA [Moorella thermoacetica]